jgi:outer membrane protein
MKKIIISLFLVASLHHGVFAQANDELKSLITKSFNYFPRVKELTVASDISAQRIELAQRNYLPNLNGAATYNYMNPVSKASFPSGPTTENVVQFQPFNNYNVNVNLSQVIYDFGRTATQVEKAKADMQIANGNIESAKFQLASQVSAIYYSLIYLKRAIAVEDSIISFFTESRNIVDNRIKRGDALDIDRYTIQATIDQEKNRKVDFENLFQKQQTLLEYTTGVITMPADTTLLFAITNATFSVAEMQNNIDVQQAARRVISSQVDYKQAKQNTMPSLNMVGATGFKNGYQPVIDDFRFNYMVGASLNIPIYQSGKLRQAIEISRMSVQANEYGKQMAESNFQKDLKQVIADMQATDERLQNNQAQLQYTDEALRLTDIRYRQGIVSYLDLINASSNHQRALLNEIQFKYQKCTAAIEWARLTGLKYWE